MGCLARRLWFALCAWSVAAVFAACSDPAPACQLPPCDAAGAPVAVSGVTAGFVGERSAIRVGWLPSLTDDDVVLDEGDVVGYEVFRAGPLALSDDVSGTVIAQQSIAQVTTTTYDDENIEAGNQYGYAVAFRFPDGTTGGLSPFVWVPLGNGVALRPEVGDEYPDFCTAAMESPVTDRVLIQPGAAARPTPGDDTVEFAMTGIVGQPERMLVQWKKALIDGGTEFLGCAVATVDFAADSCATRAIARSCSALPTALADPQVYALVLAASTAYETGVGRPSEVYLPNDAAGQWVRLDNVTPRPGNVLRAGYHEFKADIGYRIADATGLQFTAFVLARNGDGQDVIVDARPYALAATTGSELFATGVTVTADWRDVRLVARFGRGTPESVYIEDVVTYGLAP